METNKKPTAMEIIKFHEEREHGVTKSRCWPFLKGLVEVNGKFPNRSIFKAVAAEKFYSKEKGKKARRGLHEFARPGTWEKITNPKI